MRRIGIKVITGVLESQCRQLNKFFVKYITTRLPYVTMKHSDA
jgi:diaminohydroxyphosphoribosylaminopyrimidine deaminase/5-amino-6-(5-phosphoribosylamino)uracil reductase